MPRKPDPTTTNTAEPTLQVTAQQSRFHTDAIDGVPASKEILVKDLSISLGQKELLSHAELFLKEGSHYVLVGRNGVGKSSKSFSICFGLKIFKFELWLASGFPHPFTISISSFAI